MTFCYPALMGLRHWGVEPGNLAWAGTLLDEKPTPVARPIKRHVSGCGGLRALWVRYEPWPMRYEASPFGSGSGTTSELLSRLSCVGWSATGAGQKV